MVLSIDLFRTEKGGDPAKMKENQTKRYKDPKLVDTVVEKDEEWRRARFVGDSLNKLKNSASKCVGEKMKKKEPQGEDATLPEVITNNITTLTVEQIKELQVVQIKALVKLIDEEIVKNNEKISELESQRNEALKESRFAAAYSGTLFKLLKSEQNGLESLISLQWT